MIDIDSNSGHATYKHNFVHIFETHLLSCKEDIKIFLLKYSEDYLINVKNLE